MNKVKINDAENNKNYITINSKNLSSFCSKNSIMEIELINYKTHNQVSISNIKKELEKNC